MDEHMENYNVEVKFFLIIKILKIFKNYNIIYYNNHGFVEKNSHQQYIVNYKVKLKH